MKYRQTTVQRKEFVTLM